MTRLEIEERRRVDLEKKLGFKPSGNVVEDMRSYHEARRAKRAALEALLQSGAR